MKKIRIKQVINLSLALFFVVCVVLPLVAMLCRITPEGFKQVVLSKQFKGAIKNSLSTALVATVISLFLALSAAWGIKRTTIRFKGLFSLIFVVPMLIPSISHAFGLVTLFGANGIITNWLDMNANIYGFWGIVAGSVMYSFPVAFLMFSSILDYEDGMTYNAADVLGIPPLRRFVDITIPFLKKTGISAFFAVFTMIVTDYGVPLMVGGKMTTVSVLMYNKAVGMIDYDSGSVIGAFLLIPAVIAFLVDVLNADNVQSSFVSESVKPKKVVLRDAVAYAFCVVVCVAVIAPIIAFCIMVFETKYPVNKEFTLYHIQKTWNRGANNYLWNSVLYSFLTAFCGTAVAFGCAYLTARMKGMFSKVLHLVSITSMAIPGIVLGLSYVIFFHKTPIYGTIIIVVLVNSIHFFSSPYLMMYNTLAKVNQNLEDVGHCMGIARMYIVKDVILPKVKYTMYEMFVYFFVNSMMTISAVSFLAPPAPKALALMINQFEAQRLMESAAFVSLVILLINVALKGTVALLKKREGKMSKAR